MSTEGTNWCEINDSAGDLFLYNARAREAVFSRGFAGKNDGFASVSNGVCMG